jgi:DNA-binding response OmpR family regulator
MSSPGKIFDANSVGKSNGSLIFHMMTIRQALEEKLGKKAAGIIETHRGQGYSFHPEALN